MATPLAWLIGAFVLGIAELIVPGVFLIFVAVAAGIVAATLLAMPATPLTVQALMFAVWSAVAVAIGRRWYRAYPVETSDPLLNDRGARMVGQVATVVEAIRGGEGRVRVGDGEWPAAGADTEAGARVVVERVNEGIVWVRPA